MAHLRLETASPETSNRHASEARLALANIQRAAGCSCCGSSGEVSRVRLDGDGHGRGVCERCVGKYGEARAWRIADSRAELRG